MARTVKDAHQRREEIVKAACQLFLSRGYETTTMRDVMECLQVAKGTIYHYFRSKEELLDAVIEHLVTADYEQKREVVKKSGGSALHKLKQLVLSSGHDDEDQQEMLEGLHQPANAGLHIRLLARVITVQAPLYGDLIQQGCAEGVFATKSPLECAEFILSAVQFLTDMGIYPWSAEQLDRRVQALPGLIEAQLGAPRGSFAFLEEVLEHHSAAHEKQ